MKEKSAGKFTPGKLWFGLNGARVHLSCAVNLTFPVDTRLPMYEDFRASRAELLREACVLLSGACLKPLEAINGSCRGINGGY